MKVALRLQPMSMLRGTDARAAATGDYDRVSPRRLRHYLCASRLLTPEGVWSVAREVNAGVFGGRGEARKGDALEVLATTGADIAYLDPPYAGTTDYATTYRPLDDLLGDLPNARSRAPGLDELLVVARHIPLVVLSYGGPSMTLSSVVDAVGRHRPILRSAAIPYAHLRSLAKEEKNATNQEYLVVAGC